MGGVSPNVCGMWAIVIGGSVTLVAVWLGGRMARDASSRQEQARLREERRIRLHATVGQLVADVSVKVDEAQTYIPAVARMKTIELLEFADTDTGREMREREARIKRAIVELGLSVRDPELRRCLIELERTLIDWPTKAMDPVTKVDGPAPIEAVLDGLAHVRVTSAAVTAFRNEATHLLAVQLDESQIATGLLERARVRARQLIGRAAPTS